MPLFHEGSIDIIKTDFFMIEPMIIPMAVNELNEA